MMPVRFSRCTTEQRASDWVLRREGTELVTEAPGHPVFTLTPDRLRNCGSARDQHVLVLAGVLRA
jgi:hypothetical protein